jgi:hypothetical protein
MKKYQVELKYESYIMYEVEAENVDQAEDKAWEMLNDDSDYEGRSGDWSVNSVEESKDATND